MFFRSDIAYSCPYKSKLLLHTCHDLTAGNTFINNI